MTADLLRRAADRLTQRVASHPYSTFADEWQRLAEWLRAEAEYRDDCAGYDVPPGTDLGAFAVARAILNETEDPT